MNSPLPLPDWVPWWVHLVVLLAAALFGLLFLLMPFSVFGVKARLEGVEARLDEIQGEIRSLALRLPEPLEDYVQDYGDEYVQPGERPRTGSYPGGRPPIPPAPRVPRMDAPPERRGAPRSEPRLY